MTHSTAPRHLGTSSVAGSPLGSTLNTPISSRAPSPLLESPADQDEEDAKTNVTTPGSSRPPSPIMRPLPKHLSASASVKPPLPSGAFSSSNLSFTKLDTPPSEESLATSTGPAPPKRRDTAEDITEATRRLSRAQLDTALRPEESDDETDDTPRQMRPRRATQTSSASSSRRGSASALTPFLFPFAPFTPTEHQQKERVAIVGSGSWGTALARIAAVNAESKEGFESEVRMWVREKEIPGKGKLTDIINTEHEHAQYLPDIELPTNLVADPSLAHVVQDASLILFVTPHQFLEPVLQQLEKPGVLRRGARAVSAIKGVQVAGGDIQTYPSIIEQRLGIPCSALGGANIALSVAQSEFCETTIGCPSSTDAALWHAVFDTPVFRVHAVEDVAGVSLSGALKNVVALAAGFVDGLGLGGNTKAAILRIGLLEMSQFSQEFFPSSSGTTFSHHSAGVADLITTSFGGRNRKCAEAFVRTGKTFDELEKELLNGQKLQGTITAEEVYKFLEARDRLDGFPLFEKVYKISFEGMDVKKIFEDL